MRKAGDSGVPDKPWKKHVGILAYDLRGYGKRPSHERRAAQERLAHYAQACTPPGATRLGWRPTGDGGFIFFDGPLGSNFDAVGLFREEMIELGVDPLPDVRFALHDGHVNFNGSDYDGPGLILVSRLLDGMPREPAGLVVLSGSLAKDLKDDRSDFDRHLVRLIDIQAKEGPLEIWAATTAADFSKSQSSAQFSASFGPRPWGFQHHSWDIDAEEVKTFLKSLPDRALQGIRARAVLRSVVNLLPLEKETEAVGSIFGPLLHALVPPLVASTWPTSPFEPTEVNMSLISAIAISARALGDAWTNDAFDFAEINVALGRLQSWIGASSSEGSLNLGATTSFSTSPDLRAALQSKGDGERLCAIMLSPLWPEGEPEGFSASLSKLRAALLADDPSWSVWLDWYDQRLRGAPADMEKELARATALTEEDYKKGAVHMNRTVQAALEKFERERSPTPGRVDISPEEQKIVRREAPPVETPSMPGVTDAQFFANHRAEIDAVGGPVLDPGSRNDLAIFRQPFEAIHRVLEASDSPKLWMNGIENFVDEVRHLQRVEQIDRLPPEVTMTLNALREHDLLIRDRFPEEAKVNNARRTQTQYELPEETPDALEEVLDVATDALSEELKTLLGDLLKDAPVAKAKPVKEIDDQPLTIQQRDTLYRLKALMLAVKGKVDQPREMLMKALGNAENAAQAADRFVRVAEKFREVWDRIASFLTSG